MGAYTNLKNAIKQVIKQNGNQEITGQLLQNTLLSMVDTLGTDYKYCGIATPTTVPSAEEGNIYYFAKESGSYTNFTDSAHTNLHIIDKQGLYVFTKNAETGWWSSENLVSIANELGDATDKAISQNFFSQNISDLQNDVSDLQNDVLSESNKLEAVDKKSGYISNPTLPLTYGNFGSSAVYKDIPAETVLKLKCTEKTGSGYYFILTNADSSKVLETTHTISGQDLIYIFKSYSEITNLYVSQFEQTKVTEVIKVTKAISDLQNDVSDLQNDVSDLQNDVSDLQNDVLSESNKLEAVDKKSGYISNPTLPLTYGNFGSSAVYKDIPAETVLKLKCTEKTGSGYYFILTNADSSKVLETTHTISGQDLIYIFKSYSEITNLYVSQFEQTKVTEVIKVTKAISDLQNDVSDLQNDVSTSIFKSVIIGIDGDSTTAEGSTGLNSSWPKFLTEKLGIQIKYNIAMGNAYTRDRTSKTSGVEYKPQWAPSVGNNWIDYWGLADPNYGTGESTYISGTKEFDQATANNCLYAHIGYFIKQVNDGKYKEPNIFILAMGGINDTWGSGDISNIIGTVDDCIENISSWDSIERSTILRALMWAVLKLKTTFKHCILYFKTPVQQSEDRHKYFYTIYKPLIELMNFLSVPILDSYAKLGIQRNLESYYNKENNLWTSDGTHPTQDGYKKEGLFIASELVNCKYQL